MEWQTVPCSICAQTLLYTEEMSGKRDAYCANKTHLLCDTKMGLKTFWQNFFSGFLFRGFFRSCSVNKILRLCLLSGPFLPCYNCWKLLPNCISSFLFSVLFCSSKCNRLNKDVCCYKRFIFTLEGHLTLIGTVLQVSIELQKHFVKNESLQQISFVYRMVQSFEWVIIWAKRISLGIFFLLIILFGHFLSYA